MEKHSVEYSGNKIEFYLEFKNIKNLNLSIKPDLSVHVSAPKEADIKIIEEFVISKGKWIKKNIQSFATTLPLETIQKEYVSGETFKYLGRQYRLVVQLGKKESIELTSSYIIMIVRNKKRLSHRRNLIDVWFRKRALIVFQEELKKAFQNVDKYFDEIPSFEIKQMKKRWGSCLRSKNKIVLNYELIKAPIQCIEYVILHELIHFVHKNHNKDFYNLLTVLMPDWKQRKEILDEEVVLFI